MRPSVNPISWFCAATGIARVSNNNEVKLERIQVSLLVQPRPIPVCILNPLRGFRFSFALHALAVVEVQLALYNLPGVRIYVSGVVVAYCPCAVAAVSRGILLRVGFEQITSLRGLKVPYSAIPAM